MKLLPVLLLSALAAGAAVQSPPALSPAMTSLVETERAFARMSVAQGRRAAFLAFFADDALFFTPAPVNAKQVIRQWPAVAPFKLDWEPRFGDVADAGDLGYTTGPFVRTSPDAGGKIIGTGWYFTLWKKRVDGTWKVAIDAGIQGPPVGALRPAPFEAAEAESVNTDQAPGSLLAVDRALCASIASTGISAALVSAGSRATMVYRDGTPPMIGAAMVRSLLDSRAGRTACEPLKEETSRSADLGYTYGKYSTDGPRQEAGYYLRVWKRHAGEWKLAIDLLIPGS